jgi:hypothetical protein
MIQIQYQFHGFKCGLLPGSVNPIDFHMIFGGDERAGVIHVFFTKKYRPDWK